MTELGVVGGTPARNALGELQLSNDSTASRLASEDHEGRGRKLDGLTATRVVSRRLRVMRAVWRGAYLVARYAFAGALFGMVVQLLNTNATGGWRIPGIILETRAAWGAAAFLAGATARTKLRGGAAGAVVELAGVLAYYATALFQGRQSWGGLVPAVAALTVPALLAGGLSGIAGRFAAMGGPSRHVWRMAIPVAVLVEVATDPVFSGSDRLASGVSECAEIFSLLVLSYLGFAFVRERWHRP